MQSIVKLFKSGHEDQDKKNYPINNLLDDNLSSNKKNQSLEQQNKKLRKKLKQLSTRLDQEIQKAAQVKLKPNPHAKYIISTSPQAQTLQLQNAYKIIDRLQKSIKQFQNKQSYQISLKRVMDLQSIIKKKQQQIQQLKTQIKTSKKIIKDKQRYINQLIDNNKIVIDPSQDKQTINKLKIKMKQILNQNQKLRKKQLQKHYKLVTAQRKIIQMEQDQQPIGMEQNLLKQLQQYKNKYKDCMQKMERQNAYIAKLNQKLANTNESKRGRRSLEKVDSAKQPISKSLDQLPDLNSKKIKAVRLLDHIPSPHIPSQLRRY